MRQTIADMVRSMAVVLALVFVIVLLAWRPSPDAVKLVDPAPAIARAVAAGEFAVNAPDALAEEWRTTSARWEPTAQSGDVSVLHLGYVTPTDEYAQVTQSTVDTPRYLDEQTAQGSPAGEQVVGGETWLRFETPERRSLVRGDGSSVTIVSGSADWDEIATLAAALAPVATES
jgi:hypothetical protein